MAQTWQAPGRSNLIGEHVDYCEGLAMPFALPFVTTARVERVDGDLVRVESEGVGTAEFSTTTRPDDVTDWAAYVAGVVWALGERGLTVPGLQVRVASTIPLGAGLSSSAALSCSVAAAIAGELGERLTPVEVADVARRAENGYVGAQTGSMDQLASMLGEEGHVLYLDCRSLETRLIPFDAESAGLTLMLIDTQARHELVISEYGERRKDCEAAAAELGLPSLRDATPGQAAGLSSGRLRRRAHHVVSEIARVRDVADVLDAGNLADVGAFLTASHESLRDDFEVSCEELDATVEAALAAGALGARMVGGGFGGNVLVLARANEAGAVVDRVEVEYRRRDWPPPSTVPAVPAAGAHRVD